MNLAFSSKVKPECREALEELMFFNPRQHLVREGILHSLLEFGHPTLVSSGDVLSVRVGEHEAQTLFAFDLENDPLVPVGVVVYLRTRPEEIAIMHIAVHPDYALQGSEAGVGLGVTLVEKVKEIAARIVGVRQIIFFYRQEVIIRLAPGKPAPPSTP
jgi:ribosomal protein S18 acetylase RimI-like enzyme